MEPSEVEAMLREEAGELNGICLCWRKNLREVADTIATLRKKCEEQAAELEISDSIIAERNRLFDAIPECETHGKCVPHAIEWVQSIRQKCAELERDAAELTALLPGSYYMDPPDGGDITVLEQFRRMSLDAERYRWLAKDMDGNSQDDLIRYLSKHIVHPKEDIDKLFDSAMSGGKHD